MWIKNILFKLFPAECLLCGQRLSGQRELCHFCRPTLTELPDGCRCCARPLGTPGALCAGCQRQPPSFDRIWARYRYQQPLAHLLHQFKFNADLAAGRVLAHALADRLLPLENVPDLLLPVPLSNRRLRQRGFNQAVEIGRVLSARLQIPLLWDRLEKIRETPDQLGLNRAARLRNLNGAFRLSQPVQARQVALIDDVVTTGATAEQLARLLKNAGVERVEVWALARTP